MELQEVVQQLQKHKIVESILLFGSSLHKKLPRDVDICIVTSQKIKFNEKLRLLRDLPEVYDVSFYDDLPLHLQKIVLSEGKILFTRNYYALLKLMQYIELEYPRYAAFLQEYNAQRMAEI